MVQETGKGHVGRTHAATINQAAQTPSGKKILVGGVFIVTLKFRKSYDIILVQRIASFKV